MQKYKAISLNHPSINIEGTMNKHARDGYKFVGTFINCDETILIMEKEVDE